MKENSLGVFLTALRTWWASSSAISLALILDVAFVDLTTYFFACGSLILANQNGEACVLYIATPLWTVIMSPSSECLVGVFGARAAVSAYPYAVGRLALIF